MKFTIDSNYPGFEYTSREVVKYIQAGELFTLMLVSKTIVHFVPNDICGFKEWLQEHHILDIRGEKLEVNFPN